MKKINICFIILFFFVLSVPVVFFDFRDDVISEIDNRELANNPISDKKEVSKTGSFTQALDNYFSDRIGFRNDFIRQYTVLSNNLFNVMIHPTYEYGKDGYVFFRSATGDKLDSQEFYDAFLNMLIEINNYCKERNVPFYFVFEPSKSSVMNDKINAGIKYDNSWLNEVLLNMENAGIVLINNYKLLKEKYEFGEKVFNRKYDAGHWNDLGAFYGVNNILKYMKKDFQNLHINGKDDFIINEKQYNSLLVSEFTIDEIVDKYLLKTDISDSTREYILDLKISPQHKYFAYYKNNSLNIKSPKTLVFQGSYMNSYGYRFLQNVLSDYIAVHNYDNIFDFDYYYNIFKPNAVVFEVTEYTFQRSYFDYDRLKMFKLNPPLSQFDKFDTTYMKLNSSNLKVEFNEPHQKCVNLFINICVEKNKKIIDINVSNVPDEVTNAYIIINGEIFDLQKSELDNMDYSVSVLKEKMTGNQQIILINTNDKTKQVYK